MENDSALGVIPLFDIAIAAVVVVVLLLLLLTEEGACHTREKKKKKNLICGCNIGQRAASSLSVSVLLSASYRRCPPRSLHGAGKPGR